VINAKNIKFDTKDTEHEIVDWIQVAQSWVQWWGFYKRSNDSYELHKSREFLD
jgi:hypothetical protein